mgnify:CR=1 FL=1
MKQLGSGVRQLDTDGEHMPDEAKATKVKPHVRTPASTKQQTRNGRRQLKERTRSETSFHAWWVARQLAAWQ